MRSRFTGTALCVACWGVFLTACYQPGGPVPEAPLDPPERTPVPQRVTVEEEMIWAPYPRDNGEIPASAVCAWDCDFIRFTRYRPETGGPPQAVEAILVLVPGYMGGANSFDYLGRQLVSMAEADPLDGSLEVWAVDRRPNCLEDLTGMNAAEAAGDPGIVADYYYHGAAYQGHTFGGFLGEADLPYLSEFGLKLLMDDLWTIVTTKVPDPADRRRVVFMGGHSAGGGSPSYFAGGDFDGDPPTLEAAAYRNCAGLVGLDGRVGARAGTYIDEAEYADGLARIRNGTDPRLNLYMGVTPELLALFETVALCAHLLPDEESVLSEIPFSEDVAGMIRLLHSRDLWYFLTGTPAFGSFRYTNEAVLGVFFDDNFNPVSILQTSMGFLQGGPVVEKTFPGELAAQLGLPGIVQEGVFIAWDAGPPLSPGTGPLYSWVNYDRVGNASDPDYTDTEGVRVYTTWREEVSDIRDVAHSLYRGQTNFPEWYYASRIGLDTGAASGPYSAAHGLLFLHNDRIEELPLINLYAADREGYNHQDVLFAAVDRPGHRENEVFGPMMDFVFTHSGGSVTVP